MEEILSNIALLSPHGDRPFVIALSGFGGSGKTTLANRLKVALSDAEVVCIDSFSNHEWRRNADWDNFDRERFSREVLQPIHANALPLRYAHVPWPGQDVNPAVEVSRAKYVIVEGCSVFHPSLLKYYDYKIWVDCPLEKATERGMWRDRHVHKNEQDYYWQNIWMLNDRDFYRKYRPDQAADLVFESYS